MAVLTLDYRCCDRKRPLHIKHIEVERIAATARQQLVADSIDAVSFDALRQISGLKINGIDFALEVSTDYAVHDEQGNHVFGVCEFDPAMPDAAMVSISPVGESLSELLALSTLAHELGHAVFDAPGWVVQGSKGPGLFDDIEPTMQRAYRTTTPDSEHLSKSLSAKPTTEEHFAELRANEFMGSLLVPRHASSPPSKSLRPSTTSPSIAILQPIPTTPARPCASRRTATWESWRWIASRKPWRRASVSIHGSFKYV